MARIAVYVPDDRMPEIEQWREAINFSQLFIEAFDREVRSQSRLSKLKDAEMKAVVQRLKKESERTFESGWKQGVKIGTEWATKHSHISHLRQIGEGKLTFEKDDDDVLGFLRWYYQHAGYYKEPDDEREEMEFEHCGGDAITYRRGHNAGFVEAAKNVWEEVRPSFTDEQ